MNTTFRLAILLALAATRTMSCEVAPFVADVNAKWQSRDYTGIVWKANSRLSSCSNDIVALGVKLEVYSSILPNLTNAQAVARDFVAAVGVRIPAEVSTPSLLTQYAIAIRDIVAPTNYIDPVRTQSQLDYIHWSSPDEFPQMMRYCDMASRAETP